MAAHAMMPPPLSDDVLERAFVDAEAVRDAWAPAGEVEAEAIRLERAAASPREALKELVALLGERGILGLVVPSAYGGTHAHVRSVPLCLARERLGYSSPLLELAFAMQGLGSYPITARGSEALRRAYLPRVAAGAAVAAFALTEAGAGSDLSLLATAARNDGDHYVLSGTKVFISNAGIADFYVVFAVIERTGLADERTGLAPGGATKKRLSAFVVDADLPGVRTVPQRVLGGHPIGELHLSEVRVPASARIGEEGAGLSIALETLHKFRPTVGAAALGFAQRALAESVAHVRARSQFGAPLAELQAVQMALADMACDLEGARLLVYRAAAVADVVAELRNRNGAESPGDRERVGRTGSMAKLVATEAAFRVVDRAVQLHGGRGVETDHIIARLYEDVRALRIYEGASDVQRLLVAREVLKQGS